MIKKSMESQAREYVYDVKNCASEYGQSNLDDWEFTLVTDVEKIKIEKNYYPTVAVHPAQEALVELFHLVKSKILQPLNKIPFSVTAMDKNAAFLIAFNPKLKR